MMLQRPQLERPSLHDFETGDRVYYPDNPDRVGVIVRAGHEQSEVRWPDGPLNSGGISVEINRYLRKAGKFKRRFA